MPLGGGTNPLCLAVQPVSLGGCSGRASGLYRRFSMETCPGSKLLAGIMLAEKRFRLWLKGVFNTVFERLSCDFCLGQITVALAL